MGNEETKGTIYTTMTMSGFAWCPFARSLIVARSPPSQKWSLSAQRDHRSPRSWGIVHHPFIKNRRPFIAVLRRDGSPCFQSQKDAVFVARLAEGIATRSPPRPMTRSQKRRREPSAAQNLAENLVVLDHQIFSAQDASWVVLFVLVPRYSSNSMQIPPTVTTNTSEHSKVLSKVQKCKKHVHHRTLLKNPSKHLQKLLNQHES